MLEIEEMVQAFSFLGYSINEKELRKEIKLADHEHSIDFKVSFFFRFDQINGTALFVKKIVF